MNLPEPELFTRGKIRNREAIKQIRNFSGLRWGTITPTDIDGYYEINNIAFIFIEIKYKNSVLPYGQRLALQRLVDNIGEKKKAILILARHEKESGEDIDTANCEVVKFYFRGEWHDARLKQNLKEFCDWFNDYSGATNWSQS